MSSMFSAAFGRCGHFKRAQRGLYGGKERIVGNNVSFSERKTRRVWLPNVQWKKIYSDALDKQVRVRVSTYALRCIDKAGGLDNYLLTTKPEHLQSEFGEDLRVKVLLAMFEKQSVEPLAEAKDATIEKA